MRAIVYDRYGSLEELRLEEVPRPEPGRGEVLLRVEAVSLNLSDWEALTGSPFYVRVFGLWRPRMRTLGSDVAGVVEAVGPGVDRLRPGDAVFGDVLGVFGGFAEYAVLPEKMLMHKPEGVSFEHAAALPQAGVIAVRGLREGGGLEPGQRVLINGAGGGSGMFAIQIAKAAGAEVTAVDAAHKADHMRALGADHVIDYRQTDFAASGEQYDLILDLVGTRPASAVRRALRPGGTYSMVGGTMGSLFNILLLGPLVGAASRRRIKMLTAEGDFAVFQELLDLLQAGQVRLTIDGRYPLARAPEAVRRVGAGESLGKLIVLPQT